MLKTIYEKREKQRPTHFPVHLPYTERATYENKYEFYTLKLVFNTLHASWDCLYHPYGCPRMV